MNWWEIQVLRYCIAHWTHSTCNHSSISWPTNVIKMTKMTFAHLDWEKTTYKKWRMRSGDGGGRRDLASAARREYLQRDQLGERRKARVLREASLAGAVRRARSSRRRFMRVGAYRYESFFATKTFRYHFWWKYVTLPNIIFLNYK